MNKVYLSGVVHDEPRMVNAESSDAHLVFALRVQHFAARSGKKEELYRISAWNKCADYCMDHIRKGMAIGLQGHLEQRQIMVGDKVFRAAEVTVDELLLPKSAEKGEVVGEAG